jgi:hypothetical protein
MKEPRTENDIRKNICRNHCINGQDINYHIFELMIGGVCSRIQIGGSNYIGLTEFGEKLAALLFDPDNPLIKSLLDVLDLPTSFDWESSTDLE